MGVLKCRTDVAPVLQEPQPGIYEVLEVRNSLWRCNLELRGASGPELTLWGSQACGWFLKPQDRREACVRPSPGPLQISGGDLEGKPAQEPEPGPTREEEEQEGGVLGDKKDV